MAQRRPRAAGQNGRRSPLDRPDRRVADGVDATKGAVENAGRDPPMDRSVVQAEGVQLAPGHVPMLKRGGLGDFFRQPKVFSHTSISLGGRPFPPSPSET